MAVSRKQVEDILSKESENEQKVSDLLNLFHASEEKLKEQALDEKERADNLQAKIDEDEKLLEKLKKDEKSNESLQQRLKERDEHIAKLEDELISNRIKSSAQLKAISEGAINPDIVVSQLDLKQVKEDKDGKLTGLDEQFKALKEDESTAFLFKSETPQPKPEAQAEPVRNDYEPSQGKHVEVSLGKQAAKRYNERHKSASSQNQSEPTDWNSF